MADSTNNVTKDWKSVLSTAQSGLATTQTKIKSLEQQAAPLRETAESAKQALTNQTRFYQEALEKFRPNPVYSEILPLKEAYERDPSNAAKKAAWEAALAKFDAQAAKQKQETGGFPGIIQAFSNQYSAAQSRYSAVYQQLPPLYEQEFQYKQQISQADSSLGTQAKGTTPGTNTTVSATTIPAKVPTGNPNQATVTTTSTTRVTSNSTTTTNTTSTVVAVAAATAVKNATPAPTSAPNSTATTPATSTTGSATPGAPAKEPKTVLQFGDQIVDIYNPNLTPEQIASLSPGDRKAREAFFADSSTNADTAQNEIVVTATRSAVEFDTQAKASAQDAANFESFEDWRVRLTLAPDAEYMYRASNPGIMAPLAATDGVIFPYTPLISVNYQATYDSSTIVHSNYKIYQYTNSAVDQVTISCDFTAQDTSEANYLLATIHFFRSMTKMFYGQDQYPKPGTPPPLCFLFGLGGFQFDAHPLVITGFSYNLPNDVDYIRTTTTIDSTNVTKNGYFETAGNGRLPTGVLPGGVAAGATFDNDGGGFSPTYVPTKIQLSITAYPIVTRNQISNKFSLTDYATGKLLQGSQRQGGGIW